MHPKQSSHAFTGVLGHIVDLSSSLNRARINSQEHQASHIWVCSDFERQRRQRLGSVRITEFYFFSPRIDSFDRGDVPRGWEIFSDGI